MIAMEEGVPTSPDDTDYRWWSTDAVDGAATAHIDTGAKPGLVILVAEAGMDLVAVNADINDLGGEDFAARADDTIKGYGWRRIEGATWESGVYGDWVADVEKIPEHPAWAEPAGGESPEDPA